MHPGSDISPVFRLERRLLFRKVLRQKTSRRPGLVRVAAVQGFFAFRLGAARKLVRAGEGGRTLKAGSVFSRWLYLNPDFVQFLSTSISGSQVAASGKVLRQGTDNRKRGQVFPDLIFSPVRHRLFPDDQIITTLWVWSHFEEIPERFIARLWFLFWCFRLRPLASDLLRGEIFRLAFSSSHLLILERARVRARLFAFPFLALGQPSALR